MDFTADGILARMKGNLKNEDSRIEGSFTMDNLQAVSEELARFNAMLIAPLQDELAAQGSDMGTSGNEKHYVKWAKEATDAQGKRVAKRLNRKRIYRHCFHNGPGTYGRRNPDCAGVYQYEAACGG